MILIVHQMKLQRNKNVLTLSWLELFPITITSDDWNGDCDGDGCSLGLAGTEGDGLGVKNDPVGDNIP